MLKIAKEICEAQGIVFKPQFEVVVLCPRCKNKSMVIDEKGRGKCRICKNGADVFEILSLSQEDWTEQHKDTVELMKRGD
jgi:hypothetical protein